MPYRTFFDWAFSGNMKDPIPSGEGVPDILKYNSPIHATFLLKSFVGNGKMNFYLNKYLNNIGLRYIDKEDLFYFVKQCIIDFRINRRSIHYSKWSHNDPLTNKLIKKFPLLKKDELFIMKETINNSDEKDAIYRTLGLDKKEFKKKKSKKKKQVKISMKNYIAKNFNIM